MGWDTAYRSHHFISHTENQMTKTLERRIESLEQEIKEIKRYIKQRTRTKKRKDADFIEFDKKNIKRFLKKPKELYLANDLIYYFRQQSNLAGRPCPVFTWATWKKYEKGAKALYNHFSQDMNKACDYIDYVILGQENVDNPNFILLTSMWSQKWLSEMSEWLLDRKAASWNKGE